MQYICEDRFPMASSYIFLRGHRGASGTRRSARATLTRLLQKALAAADLASLLLTVGTARTRVVFDMHWSRLCFDITFVKRTIGAWWHGRLASRKALCRLGKYL